MITFVEKEHYFPAAPPRTIKPLTIYSIHMLKDDKEFLIVYRGENGDTVEIENYKQQLSANNGAYFAFSGYKYKNPFETLKVIASERLPLNSLDDLFSSNNFEKEGHIDFTPHSDIYYNYGKSIDFFAYRIYDATLVEKIKTIVALMIDKRWNDALKMILEEE
jgi:hypothetical protein